MLSGAYILNQTGERNTEKRVQSKVLKMAAVVLEPLLSGYSAVQGHFIPLAQAMGLEGRSTLCRSSLPAAVVMSP